MIINKYKDCIGCGNYDSQTKECSFLYVIPASCPCQFCIVKTNCSRLCEPYRQFRKSESLTDYGILAM